VVFSAQVFVRATKKPHGAVGHHVGEDEHLMMATRGFPKKTGDSTSDG